MAKDTVEKQIEESLGLYPRFNREEAQAQAKRKPPPLDELNYNKPLVSYKKTTNAPSGQDKIADISSLSRLNSPPPQGEKESLNVGPFTYNSGRNSLTGSAFVEKKSTPNTTYPDGAVVNTQGKAVGIAVNGRLLLNKEGDNSLTAGFNKVKNTSNTNVQLPDGKTQQFSDGSTAKGYNLGATLGRFIFDARKNTSTKGKDRYSGKVTYLLGDNADISIQDSTGGDTTVGFGFRKSFNHGGLASEHQDSDPEEMGYVEQAIKLFGSTIGFPNALDIFKGEPEETPEVVAPEVVAPEVVAPEVMAPEVVAPEVVTPADTQTQEAFDLDTADSTQSDEVAPLTNPQEEATVEPIESVELDNAIDDAVEEAIDSVVQTDDEKYADDAQYQEFGIPTGQDDREVSVVTNKIVELGYLIRERALRAVTRLDNVEYVPTGPFRMLSGLTQKANLETVNKFITQALGAVDKNQDVSKEGVNWCAAFVNHILTELGADTLGKGEKGYNDYLRIRADAYKDYGQDIYTRKDGLENYGKPIDFNSMQEGDIILIDFDPPGKDGHGQVDHVGFWAGNKVRGQEEGFVSVIGGNQGPSDEFIDPALQGQEKYGVTIKRNTYRNANILGVRRITYDNDAAIIAEDQKKKDRMSIFHGLEPSAASFISTDEVNASNAPRKSLRPQLRPDTLPTPTTDFEGNPIKTYAEGGLTSMDDQTQMAFALGGEAETVDPVSGNDVPPGSLPEEVRDDIDAKLSEGEYVVPADVVRFFGVKYFEDLRMEAKMGLQQMDADGRIGGEPVPAEQPQGQEDSMDVAQLKAALSESGMYAGGLTDGNSLDAFIDDASRSPMVNGRMRANGATVKMAVGGLATGNFGDVTKVDGIIKELMTAANNNPTLMDKLASKGIMVNKTGANQTPKQMEQSNKPNSSKEPVLEAAEGALVEPRAFAIGGGAEADTSQQTSPFDFNSASNPFTTLGGNLFKAAGLQDAIKTVDGTLLNEKGEIKQIVLIAPDGTEIAVAWNTLAPLPPGFTQKETDELSTEDVQFESASSSPVVVMSSQGPRKLDSRAGESDNRVNSVNTNPKTGGFNWATASAEDVNKRLQNNKNMRFGGSIAGILAGLAPPVSLAIGIAQGAYNRAENTKAKERLEQLKQEGNWNPLEKGIMSNEDYATAIKNLTDPLKKAQTELRDDALRFNTTSGSLSEANRQQDGSSIQSMVQAGIKFLADKIVGTTYDAVASTRQAGQTAPDAVRAVPPASYAPNTFGFAAQQPEPVPEERVAQQAAATERLYTKEAKAKRAAEREADRVSTRDARVASGELRKNKNGGGYSYAGSAAGLEDYRASKEKEFEETRTEAAKDFFGGFFGNEGGLVAKPAAKQKNNKTTQRRKGLGTRP